MQENYSKIATLLFKYLPPADARMLIRNAFPPFYQLVIFFSGVTAVLSRQTDLFSAGLMALVMLTAMAARLLLMLAINRATDIGYRNS